MDIRLSPSRIIPSAMLFAAALWFGVFGQRNLAPLQGVHPGLKLMFALGMTYAGFAIAVFVVSRRMDAFLRVLARWGQRLRRALAVLMYGQADCGPFRVISLRSGSEMARFTTADDAFAWANSSPVLNGSQGARYEVRNMAGDILGHPKTSDPCKCLA